MYNWVKAARQLIYEAANWIKLERLRKPYSMLAPKPFHFPQFSKLDQPWVAQSVMAEGLEMDALHTVYGMPRGIPQMILTVSGALYGQEFADLTIEYFGLQGQTEEPEGVNRIAQRTIGNNIVFSNADPDTLPFGAGCSFAINDLETGQCKVRVHAWRWRIFMDNSSLCLENNWHTNSLTGGGWIPFILGVKYDNPEKMMADTNRFTPAFKLCNLVDARLSRRGRPEKYETKEEFLSALSDAAKELEIAGDAITQPNIAGAMEADERQIRLWCDKFDVDWSAWKKERKGKPDKTGN
jgi:hypothetical protein